MSDEARVIIDLLNKPPFNKSLTLIAFDAVEPLALLQILSDVFGAISPDV